MATGGYRLAAVLAFVIVAGTTAAGWHGSPPPGHAASRAAPPPHAARATGRAAATEAQSPAPSASTSPAPSTSPNAAATRSPVLTARARSSCPAAASACVDLGDHLTWLQSGSRITYGPVSMEPGRPGTRDATPRGTFHVEWKAGPDYISTEFHEPMPYAVFFAVGGIAFHGGSLTLASHGCVHLNIGSARYYHDHLPIGAEVAVF
jgi:lipoprotein-anchoring transpeptidase ErfK/SrfK